MHSCHHAYRYIFFFSLFLQAGQSLFFFSFTWPSHYASSCISILARSEKEGKIDLDRKKGKKIRKLGWVDLKRLRSLVTLKGERNSDELGRREKE